MVREIWFEKSGSRNLVREKWLTRKKRHDCKTCGMSFGQKVTLIKHMETVHEGKEYKCTLCTKVFKSEYILQNHIDFDHKGKKNA